MRVSLNRFDASILRTRSRAWSELSPPTTILISMLLSFDKSGWIETTCRCAGITRSRSSKSRVHENALRAKISFRKRERSRTTRFCGRFSVASAWVFSSSNRAITDSMSAISLRSRFALINLVVAMKPSKIVARQSNASPVPQLVQNRRASSYGWLARLMSIRIFRKQGAHYARHSPFRNRAATQSKLRSGHQLAHFGAGLRMQRWCRTGNVRDAGDKNLFNIGAVCVLKKHHRRIHVFGQLLPTNRDAASVLEGSKQQQLILVEDGNARGARIHFHHQRAMLSTSSAQRRQHRRQYHSWTKSRVAK